MASVSDAQRYQLARAAGFDPQQAVTATAISIAEDRSGDPAALSPTRDLGLWQINSVHWPRFGGQVALSDPLTNARAAFAIFRERGWNAWNTFTSTANNYTQFLQRATMASGQSSFVFPLPGWHGIVSPHGVASSIGGTDLMAPRGTQIVSVGPGTVVSAGSDPVGGNNVLIHDPASNLDFYYAHLDNAPLVKAGQTVSPGTFLGQVGNTGNAAGGPAHLHIGIGFGIQTGSGAFGGTGKGFDAVGLLSKLLGGGGSSTDLTSLIQSVGGINVGQSGQTQGQTQFQIQNPIDLVASAISGVGTSIHDAIATFVLSLLHVILGIFFLVMILLGLYLLLAS